MKSILLGLRIVVVTALYVVLIASCGTLNRRAQQQTAREGLESIRANRLPDNEIFEHIETVSLNLARSEYDTVCYYARDYLIMGTRLPESEAIERFSRSLLPLGWTREGTQYRTSNGLVFGQNTRIVVRYGDPGADLHDTVDFSQLRKNYESLLMVRIDYILPRREGC